MSYFRVRFALTAGFVLTAALTEALAPTAGFDFAGATSDAKTIATHPATTTHQRLPQDQKDALGITPGLIRLSLGLEDAGDLIADLKRGLDRV